MDIFSVAKNRNLTTRLTATTSILTVIVVIVLGGFFVIQQEKRIYADLKLRGMSLAKTAAHNSLYGVTIGDEETLLKLIRGIEAEKDVSYVIIQDAGGNILACTETELEQEAASGKVNKEAMRVTEADVFTWKPDGEPCIYDVAAPVFSSEEAGGGTVGPGVSEEGGGDLSVAAGLSSKGKIGVVRVGMSSRTAQVAIERSIVVTILLTIGLIILSIFITGTMMKNILNPLQRLATTVRAIGEGDLTVQITESSANNEVGLLASAFKQMQKNVQNMVSQIQKGAESVDSSVTELSSSSRQQAAGATEQSRSLTETASTVEELSTVSRQISENAQKVAELANQSLAGMETIRTNTIEGANRIIALGEKSQSIGEVVGMIDDITRQTNLLALNASIESARAGEAGKGFAVVATEIRKLATNVANSTNQIREIIKEIQDATNSSVLATENISRSVENGIEISKMASESASQISMATQQQNSASTQMVASIKEMVIIAQQTSKGSEQIAETAYKLAQTTKEQREIVRQFKIG